MAIKKTIFGSDLFPKIKNKLKARQLLNSNIEPNQSLENITDESGKSFNLIEALGGPAKVNFYKSNFEQKPIADMTSRTPFIRMWTAVQFFYTEKTKTKSQLEEVFETQKQFRDRVAGEMWDKAAAIRSEDNFLGIKE